MSSSEDTADVVAEFSSFLISNYCSNAATTLYMYEYLLTIDYEVELFWRRKFTGASALFFLNRYLRLWFYIAQLIFWASLSSPVRRSTCLPVVVVLIRATIPSRAFSGLRMFAISSKNWSLSIIVFALSIVPFATDLVNMRYGITGETLPDYGCSAFELTPAFIERRRAFAQALQLTIAGWTCLMGADLLLIVVTWFALPRRTLRSSPNSFAHVLLYDGTIYFVILLILNTLHLVFTTASLVTPALQNASDMIVFIEPVTAILVQCFLIHLQLANRKALHVGTSQNAGFSQDSMGTLVFERVVGSLSASLTPDDYVPVSSTDVDSAMFSKSSDASDAGEGDVDDGRGKESIPLEPV
ncbi:hypothetical protein GSI_07544 [Ganoderma sinense ZZ0214-1]|uniref:DUF6533 domain-containing protein n=1 Tax=Ganoderma sinense ZZ0214-1 TaxID=1077348 RepID=A0A2G8S9C7_9APHY|nr:hypothetical protein GSI_07544 [Ganoderma sinense ZZ0214-1]